ncbi:3-oxoacyl-ACP reductase [Lactobacillus sp. CC-MHH1034]|uniref:3-oxoacyl-ACP reductase n=1 Tax=Agrilactobacillus fermenti TaxID=2586909 RepID=UPI001E490423|nr:3-oxoacyl-ACP reductase [Agrilactobacillus fermenti]MCD2257144.1 3-oxoacyl-ACP reductase [Agrilactobacillus fermenti]
MGISRLVTQPTYPELVGKTALITGANSGIGFQQTLQLLQQGTNCYVTDRQLGNALQTLLDRYPQQLNFYRCDLSQEDQLQQTVTKIKQDLGRETMAFLLNTAGILDGYRPTLETTSQTWDTFMQTDLKSQFLLVNAFLPDMIQNGHGKIVNMASIAGLVAGGGGAVYTAAKHAVIGYTKQLDYDYAAKGISANCLAPGAIDTPMNAADFAGTGAMAKAVAQQTPAKRWGTAKEVALTTLFLLSDGADFIHGVVIPIDGGWIEQ